MALTSTHLPPTLPSVDQVTEVSDTPLFSRCVLAFVILHIIQNVSPEWHN